jgi:hypothetical protein
MSDELQAIHPGSLSRSPNTLKEFLSRYSEPNEIKYITSYAKNHFPGLFQDPYILVYAGFYSGIPNNKTILNCDLSLLAQYIKDNYVFGMRIIFDTIYEGNVDIVIDRIHQIVKLTGIPADQYYYLTGAINADEIYDKMCDRLHEHMRVNIGIASVWDYHGKISSSVGTPVFNVREKSKLMLCFNRVTRLHRLILVCLFIKEKIIDRSYYSFFLNYIHGNESWEYDHMMNNARYGVKHAEWFDEIVKICDSNRSVFPLKLNIESTYNKNFLDSDDCRYYEDSYFSLVTETFFFDTYRDIDRLKDEDAIFFSEKTFKPIAMKHPFIIASRPHMLAHLRKMGYKTFSPFINESYDTIEDNYDRILAIVKEVVRLNNQTTEQWIEWQNNIKNIIEHNYENFMNTNLTDNSRIYYAKKN